MNDLTTRNPEASETWTRLSPGLKSLLTLGDRASAIRDLTLSPPMLAEAKMSLFALKSDATLPAGLEGVRRVVGTRLALYPPMTKTDGAWAAWWKDYVEALGDLPEAALEAGMKAWIRAPESEFLPAPGRLRQLAQQAAVPAITAYDRAKAAIQTDAPPEEKPRAQKEAVARMMEDFRARVAVPPERKSPPPIHGATDETGITPAMRAVLVAREDRA